jgi:hypothetical protein
MYGEMRNAYKMLIWKPLGRPRHGCKDSIKMDIKELEFEDVDSI